MLARDDRKMVLLLIVVPLVLKLGLGAIAMLVVLLVVLLLLLLFGFIAGDMLMNSVRSGGMFNGLGLFFLLLLPLVLLLVELLLFILIASRFSSACTVWICCLRLSMREK